MSVGLRDVGGDGDGADAKRFALGREFEQTILAAGGEDDVRALARELERRLAADAGGGAGDDGDGIASLHAPSLRRGWC